MNKQILSAVIALSMVMASAASSFAYDAERLSDIKGSISTVDIEDSIPTVKDAQVTLHPKFTDTQKQGKSPKKNCRISKC